MSSLGHLSPRHDSERHTPLEFKMAQMTRDTLACNQCGTELCVDDTDRCVGTALIVCVRQGCTCGCTPGQRSETGIRVSRKSLSVTVSEMVTVLSTVTE